LFSETDEGAAQEDIAAQLREDIEAQPNTMFVLGPGSTLQAVGRALHVDKTLLGIDAVVHAGVAGKDLDERGILDLLEKHPACKLVLSPIGAQGFVLGRGNQQLSPAVIRRLGADNIVVVATPAKLARTPLLRFDSGDSALDAALISRRFYSVIIGYHRLRLVKAMD
jgi:predicted polyphosphate/ATP-dependent NAD kinase